MPSQRKVGVYGMFFPPIEMCVEYAKRDITVTDGGGFVQVYLSQMPFMNP